MRRLGIYFLLCSACCSAQTSSLDADLKWLSETTAVSGYETTLITRLEKQLAAIHPQRDSMGNLTLTFGSGAPHRMIASPVDEPGYVVSLIENHGYLRVVRLPQNGLPAHYNEMQNAQPMVVTTLDGGSRSAVVAGLSIHLQPGRSNIPDPDDIDNMYVDHNIAVQYGVTGGGNDGAAFQRYGATDVALSWPLRNSHSPGEITDLRDLDALSAITAALAREWHTK